jgi:hypothetical protein
VQVDPIKPNLKAPGIKRLKLKYDKLLSSFAFKFNLHRFNMVHAMFRDDGVTRATVWRCRLTLSNLR